MLCVPDLMAAYRRRGDEMIGHGRSNAERQIEMSEADERVMVNEVTAKMTRDDGVKPEGWMSPYLTPSLVTTDLVAEAGYKYIMDWGICDEITFHQLARCADLKALGYGEVGDNQLNDAFRRFKDVLIEVLRADCDDERWAQAVSRARELQARQAGSHG